jgi:tetratricopeptide (TPR) repeat protein
MTGSDDPSSWPARLAAVLAHHGRGAFDVVERETRELLAVRPGSVALWNLLGAACQAQGRRDAAAAAFLRAVELDPLYADAHNNLGTVLQEAGDQDGAIAAYRRAIAIRADHADAHNNMGNALAAGGDAAGAIAAFARAVAARPGFALAHLNMGNLLHRQGRHDEAIAAYRAAIAASKTLAAAYHGIGNALHAKRDHGNALAFLQYALALQPGHAEALNDMGVVRRALGDLDGAIDAFRRAIAIRPALAAAHANLAGALQAKGATGEAIAVCRQAVAIQPGDAQIHVALGNALHGDGQHDAAIAAYRDALAIDPDDAAAHGNLGASLDATGRFAEAVAALRHALALRPDFVGAQSNLGTALKGLGDLDGAVQAFRRAIALDPGHLEAQNGLATVLQAQGDMPGALAAYDRALEIAPDNADAQWNRAWVALLLGDYRSGWAGYGARWRKTDARPRRPSQKPEWTGAQPVAGRRVLLWSEQGLGDQIQFCRYAPLVAAMGARVMLEVDPPLVRLMSGLRGIESVAGRNAPVPDDAIDLHAPLMSLPRALGTTLETVPAAIPYLFAEPAEVAAWRDVLAARAVPRIGLVWSGSARNGNDRSRSIPLARLLPLLDFPAEFHALQREYRDADLATMAADGRIRRHDADFAQTAALVACLDLAICVDTSLAHLAGALGKPVWIMLAHAPDFRWMTGRDDSPWYPSARLFRQTRPGDWDGVVERIGAALRAGFG